LAGRAGAQGVHHRGRSVWKPDGAAKVGGTEDNLEITGKRRFKDDARLPSRVPLVVLPRTACVPGLRDLGSEREDRHSPWRQRKQQQGHYLMWVRKRVCFLPKAGVARTTFRGKLQFHRVTGIRATPSRELRAPDQDEPMGAGLRQFIASSQWIFRRGPSGRSSTYGFRGHPGAKPVSPLVVSASGPGVVVRPRSGGANPVAATARVRRGRRPFTWALKFRVHDTRSRERHHRRLGFGGGAARKRKEPRAEVAPSGRLAAPTGRPGGLGPAARPIVQEVRGAGARGPSQPRRRRLRLECGLRRVPPIVLLGWELEWWRSAVRRKHAPTPPTADATKGPLTSPTWGPPAEVSAGTAGDLSARDSASSGLGHQRVRGA